MSAFVLDDDGRLLMIRRTDNGLYALPGGRHELGETMTETAVRETREETGITVEVDGLIGIYSNPDHVVASYDDGEVRQEFSICFRAAPSAVRRGRATSPAKSCGSSRDELERSTGPPVDPPAGSSTASEQDRRTTPDREPDCSRSTPPLGDRGPTALACSRSSALIT